VNQRDAQLKYKEFQDKLRAPYCVGVTQHIERIALKKELEQFRQSCSANGITLLEPCPFCGSYELLLNETNCFWVVCLQEQCGAEGPTNHSKSVAIAALNQRVN
jgi:hypothetical protein